MDMRTLIDLAERAVGGPQLTVYEGPTSPELEAAHAADPDGRVLGVLAENDRLIIWPASFADGASIMEKFGINRFRAIPLDMQKRGPVIIGDSADYLARASETVRGSPALQNLYGKAMQITAERSGQQSQYPSG